MPALEKRVAALEQASHTTQPGPFFIYFVGLDTKDIEIERIKKGSQHWERLPGESEKELKDRASQEVTPPLPNCRSVFMCY